MVLAVVGAVDLLSLWVTRSSHVGSAALLDVLLMATTLVGWALLGGPLWKLPEATAWAVSMGVVAFTILSGMNAPSLAMQSMGYLLLLPGMIALIVPWRTELHVAWLVVFAFIVSGYLVIEPSQRFRGAEREQVFVVFLVAVAASYFGHRLLRRADLERFAQLENIRKLQRKVRADVAELEAAQKALELTSRIDPLTGAGNRRRLDEDLRTVRAHIYRSSMTYGLLAIDLDHFKRINDGLGHLAGDEVLKRVVHTLKATLRPTDALYRFGGEEFVVVLSVATEAGLTAAAERLCRMIQNLRIPHPDSSTGSVVTVSIGAVLLTKAHLAASDAEWFELADRAMYAAKSGGRNRVHVYRQPWLEPS